MDKYYYVVAQLPMLSFGKEPGLTIDYFLDETGKWLSRKDYKILASVNMNDISISEKTHSILALYKHYEYRLRTDIARWRQAQKSDQDYKPESFPVSVLKEGNPLDIELKFMEMRWTFIDELERERHFDLGMLILYYLKLQLLQRYFTFNKEKGLNKFQKLYEVHI